MPFPAPTGYAPPELLNGGYSAPSSGVVTPEIASQIQQMNEQAAMYGQPGLPEPQVGSPLMPYVLDLAAQDMSFAQNIAQAGGIPWDQVQPHIDQAQQQIRSDVGGGVIGRAINSAVRPVGEYFAEHPAALFALPFAVGGAMGAFGAGAAGGGGAAAAGGGGGAATTFPLASGGAITGSAIPGVTSAATSAGAAAAGIAPAAAGGGLTNALASQGASNAANFMDRWGGLVVGGANTLLGVDAANDATDAQVAGDQAAIDEMRRQYDTTRSDLMPWMDAGRGALNNLQDPNAFTASPGYAWAREQGISDIGNSFASRGGAASGNAMRALAEFQTGLANQDYNNWWNRQAGLAGVGQNATTTVANVGQNTSANVGNALSNQGASRASGVMNRAGTLANGFNQGYSNWLYRRRFA